MIGAILASVLALASPIDTEQEGVVSLSRTPGAVVVVLNVAKGVPSLRLEGPQATDLRKLQSARVRVRGKLEGRILRVEGYDLLSVYGKTPIVGQITEISGKIALVDGDGPAILLNLPPRSYKRFLEARGHRSWVTGKLLLSGEFKVGRYGILKSHVSVPKQESPEETKEQK